MCQIGNFLLLYYNNWTERVFIFWIFPLFPDNLYKYVIEQRKPANIRLVRLIR